MFDTFGTIDINGKNIKIDSLSLEELKEYLQILNNNNKDVINKQNEYLSQLIG